jgi:hypothetical protein
MQDLASAVEPDDASLARRIAAAHPGTDAEAEGALYRRLAPRVRLYGLRHLRDGPAAADLMQQVMLMTLEKLRAGDVRQPLPMVPAALNIPGCHAAWIDYPSGSVPC